MLGLTSIADQQIVGQIIRDALPEMTDQQRICFVLYFLLGMTQERIAWVVGISQPTVCEHLQKSEQKIHEISSDYL